MNIICKLELKQNIRKKCFLFSNDVNKIQLYNKLVEVGSVDKRICKGNIDKFKPCERKMHEQF